MTDFEAMRAAFGARLRALRERQRLSGRDLAARLDWPQSKVSKLETGKQTAETADVVAWCAELRTDAADLLAELRELRAHQLTWRRVRSGASDREAARQNGARRIRAVDVTSVGALVQTADYARRLCASRASLLDQPPDADAAELARVRRQEALYDSAKRIEILLGEAALAHPVADPAEMVVQLDRLMWLVGLPHVRFGILPLFRPLPHAPVHGYRIIDDHVIVENLTADIRIADPEQVAVYHRLTDRLWKAAVEGAGARAVLTRLAERFTTA
ncbi:Transcriptional regulator, contains XRE-family HTH domain [Amycolatopsis arida]|uniref:Transcriptional regulator, contains XRE-family HTH domain n=1 Tax=Amycolatopsis arida TaxID=587909 RepID=A0A1I5YD50_9PSEU|nr:helix-turn-helix transcriptional regulator [Amycolatopsis arida]TDX90431.1 transcriptional regulator with XRE-family HTH domain [Amycolatopsis arida]SFQ42118.1 Transcriptional regulator, contains XRE-family HTH domain [Amycolatopsis arida]